MQLHVETERMRGDAAPSPVSEIPFRPQAFDGASTSEPAADAQRRPDRLWARLVRRPLFVALVLVPNLLSILYFALIASPVYTSSASLLVLNPRQSGPSLSSLIAGASGDSSEEGGYILKAYFASWDAFRKADRRLDLAKGFASGDVVSRFGGAAGLFRTDDVALWRYFRKHLTIDIDQKSGIVSLAVDAYDPGYAVAVERVLLADAIAHMDGMNAEQERDRIAGAVARRAAVEARLQRDLAALAAYRHRTGSYDPKELYVSNLALMNSLSLKESDLRAQRDAVVKTIPGNPQAQTLADAIASVRRDMAATQRGFAATGQGSSEFEKLLVARDDDVTLLGQANQVVQEAQASADRNHYYLNVISSPSEPMTPEKPRRLLWIGAIALATLALWGLLR